MLYFNTRGPLLLKTVGLVLIAFVSIQASARSADEVPSRSPGYKEFFRFCKAHRDSSVEIPPPAVGRVSFLSTKALDGNQGRFSWASLLRKLGKGLKAEPDAYIDKKKDEWVFPYNEGRSFYPIERAIRALYYRGRLYIVDGHHRALISTYLGTETIPVRVIADVSKLQPQEFEDMMDRKGLSYFRNYRGQATRRVDLCDMVDDPNLELARILIARARVEYSGNKIKISDIRGSEVSIGIKSAEQDIPFLEFLVADALRRAGVEWENGNDPDIPRKQLKEYLEILKAAAERGGRLAQVLLFDRPERVVELDLKSLMLDHLAKIGCENALRIKAGSGDDE